MASRGFQKSDSRLVWGMTDTREFLVHCASADEADPALGLGFAIETTPQVAAEGREEPL